MVFTPDVTFIVLPIFHAKSPLIVVYDSDCSAPSTMLTPRFFLLLFFFCKREGSGLLNVRLAVLGVRLV